MAYACNCPPGYHDGPFYRLCVGHESTSNDLLVHCQPTPREPVTVSCEAVPMSIAPDPRIASLEQACRNALEQVESWQRVFGQLGDARDTIVAQRDTALREVARLEALIVEAVVSGPGHVPDCIYNECLNIRNRKGESSC